MLVHWHCRKKVISIDQGFQTEITVSYSVCQYYNITLFFLLQATTPELYFVSSDDAQQGQCHALLGGG